MFLTLYSNCAKHDDSASVSVARVMWICKRDENSSSGENWKEPDHQQYQQKHHLIVTVMNKLLMWIKLVGNNIK